MAIYSMRSGVPKHPEDTVLMHLTDLVRKSGVLDPETDLLTAEPSGGGRNVDIGTGRCYVKKNGNAYPIRNTSTVTKAVAANSSGNSRIDLVVAYVDLTVIPDGLNSVGEDVAFFEIVQGTPAASPVMPNESQIESAIGAANPYCILDTILVVNGATGISNSDIDRVAERVFMKTPTPVYPETYAATLAPNYNNGPQQTISLTGNIVINEPTNMIVGDVLFLDFIQDATGGRTATWTFTGVTVKEDGGEVALSGTANAVDTVGIRKISADTYYIYPVGGEIA